MRLCDFIRAALVAGAALAFASAAAAAAPAILLSVDRDNTHTGTGADRVRQVKIEINVRSVSTNTITVQLEWFFVASPVGGFGYYISDQGKNQIKMPARKVANLSKSTSRLIEKDVTIKGKPAKQIVAETTGYIVRILAEGKVIAMQADPVFLERKAADPEEFKKLLSNQGPK